LYRFLKFQADWHKIAIKMSAHSWRCKFVLCSCTISYFLHSKC